MIWIRARRWSSCVSFANLRSHISRALQQTVDSFNIPSISAMFILNAFLSSSTRFRPRSMNSSKRTVNCAIRSRSSLKPKSTLGSMSTIEGAFAPYGGWSRDPENELPKRLGVIVSVDMLSEPLKYLVDVRVCTAVVVCWGFALSIPWWFASAVGIEAGRRRDVNKRKQRTEPVATPREADLLNPPCQQFTLNSLHASFISLRQDSANCDTIVLVTQAIIHQDTIMYWKVATSKHTRKKIKPNG